MTRHASTTAAHDRGAADARQAGLRYASDDEPGVRRIRRGRGFSYVAGDGRRVGTADRRRVEALAIPPAWTDVWIAPDARAHLQATGRDDRGRKQYRYHDEWRAVRDAAKFDRLEAFGRALDDLRPAVDAMLRKRGAPKEKVVAAVVRILDDTLVRVGNDTYARDNDTFGVTTLAARHLDSTGAGLVAFDFVAKSGRRCRMSLDDPRLARIVRRCHELGGRRLFAYETGDGDVATVTSQDVNDLLLAEVGEQATAKDFRTWGATRIAAASLLGVPDRFAPPADDPSPSADPVVRAVDAAAAVLGNSRAVCRASYVHPGVLDAHETGSLDDAFARHRDGAHLDRVERTVLDVLSD